jgi:hypothetical protein
MKTLSEISQLYPTDKDFTHNYYNLVYENALNPIKNKVKLLCEIGVGGIFDWGDKKIRPANSLKVWRDYFTNANILGLDIVKYPEISDMDRISIDWLDQSKKDLIIEYSNKLNNYDIIIDDGSHNVYDQHITLAYFFKSLKSEGIYILEDLHTSLEAGNSEKAWCEWGNAEMTLTLDMLKNFIKTGKIISNYISDEDKAYLEDQILSAEIYQSQPEWSITSVIIKK